MRCREYQGRLSPDGYGVMYRDGKDVRVHRWVVAQVLGWEAIKGLVVRHTCDNPPCFLYEHLLVGTHADNVADRQARGRDKRSPAALNALKTECKHGHPFDPANTYIRKNGTRNCRECRRLVLRAFYARHGGTKARPTNMERT